MILYILLGCVLLYLLFFMYIKIRFRFWSIQPVFHIYNLYYWLFPCGILYQSMPSNHRTKFYDQMIDTQRFSDCSAEKKALLYFLISSQYLRTKEALYQPTKSQVLNYFYGHLDASYLSLCYDNVLRNNRLHKKVVGSMTTRPLIGYLHGHKLDIGYVDFLCVHKKYRKKGYAQKLIYSHYVNVRKQKSQTIYLFKREGAMNLIVPLCVYFAYTFSMKRLHKPNFKLPANVVCTLVSAGNFPIFQEYFGENGKKFTCFIAPNMAHLKFLVEHKNIFICVLMVDNVPKGFYIYRNCSTKYKNKLSIELIASYYELGFYEYFMDSLQNTIVLIEKNIGHLFDLLLIENISNNNDVISMLRKKTPILWKCPMAYFFYNFIQRPLLPKDVLLVC